MSTMARTSLEWRIWHRYIKKISGLTRREVIGALNNPLSSNETVQRVQHELYTLGKTESGWKIAETLLEHPAADVQWHGANMLHTKIQRGDFLSTGSDDDGIEFVRGLLELASSRQSRRVRTKLIVAYIAAMVRFGVDEFELESKNTGFILEVLTELPHEVNRIEFSDVRREARFMESINIMATKVEALCSGLIGLPGVQANAGMECLASWAEGRCLKHGADFCRLLVSKFPMELAVTTCDAILDSDSTTGPGRVLMNWFANNQWVSDELPLVQLAVNLAIKHTDMLLESETGLLVLRQLAGCLELDEEVSGVIADSNVWNEVAETWLDMEEPCAALKPIMMQVAQTAFAKMGRPEGLCEWSMDDQQRFRLYRRDLAEALDACTAVVGQDIPRGLVSVANEAALFALAFIVDRSFSKAEYVDWMDRIVSVEFVSNVTSEEEKLAYLELIKAMSAYLQNVETVEPVLKLVMTCLADVKMAPSAALAFCELAKCKSVRMDSDMWMHLWSAVGTVAGEAERTSVYRALGQLVRRVPGAGMVIAQCAEIAELDKVLWLVQGLGRGRLEDGMERACEVVWQRFFLGGDDDEHVLELAEECCSCGKHAFPLVETHGKQLASWLMHGYQQNPTQAKYLTVVAEMLGKVPNEWARELLTSMGQIVRQMEENSMEEYPDVVHAFFGGLVTRAVTIVPDVLLELDAGLSRDLFCRMLPLGLRVQERLAFLSVVQFIQLLLQQDGKLRGLVDAVLRECGPVLVHETLEGISSRAARSLVGHLAELLCRLLNQGVSLGVVPGSVSEAVKAEFVKNAVKNTRHLKRFKDIVNEYSLKCRGWTA